MIVNRGTSVFFHNFVRSVEHYVIKVIIIDRSFNLLRSKIHQLRSKTWTQNLPIFYILILI